MTRKFLYLPVVVLLFGLTWMMACDDEENPVAPFQPEIVNDTNSFEYQATGATDVNGSHDYVWVNTSTKATINHSTSTIAGVASIAIFDADSTEVYRSVLKPSALEETSAGTTGNWYIHVEYTDWDGAVNFRVESL
jgi:hypothetical protein